jgi:hypothetical protein
VTSWVNPSSSTLWSRSGTTLEPTNSNDTLQINGSIVSKRTGAAQQIYTGFQGSSLNYQVLADGAITLGTAIGSAGGAHFNVINDGTLKIGNDINTNAGTNITLKEDGDAIITENLRLGTNADPAARLDITAQSGDGGNQSVIRFNIAGTEEAFYGISNKVGNIITGSAVGDSIIRNNGNDILFSTDSGSTIHFIVDKNGNVGIGTGTTAPAQKLEVKASSTGGIRISQPSQTYYHEITNNGDGLKISADAGDTGGSGADIRLEVKGDEIVRCRPETVGIGTVGNNYVESRLETRDTISGGNTGIRITNDTTNADSKASLMFTASTADFISAALAYDRTTTALGFYVGQTSGSSAGDGLDESIEWWRMDNNGNFQSTHTAGAAPVYASSPSIQTGYGWLGDSASGSLAVTTNLYRDSSDDAWKHIGSKVDGLRGSMLSLGFGTLSGFVAATPKDRGQNAVLTQVFGTTTVGSGSSQRVDVNIKKGNIVMESDGTGIDFGAVGGSSATSSILDDYEEGTWSPLLSFGGARVDMVQNRSSGNYTKIGNVVNLAFQVSITAKGTSTGSVAISLPYTVQQTSGNFNDQAVGGSVFFQSGISSTAPIEGAIQVGGNATTDNARFYYVDNTTSVNETANLTDAQLDNDFRIIGNISYITDQ